MQMEVKKPPVGTPVDEGFNLVAALKDAGFAALVTLGLSIPILAFNTKTDMSNALIVSPRIGLAAGTCLAVFVARMLALVYRAYAGRTRQAKRPQELRKQSRAETTLKTYAGLFVVAALIAFPLVMLGLLGPQGSLKWINNYGIQILIYIMLGWGLNIVVGLAGPARSRLCRLLRRRGLFLRVAVDDLRPVVLGLPAARRHPRRLLGRHPRLPGAAAAR